MGGEIRSSTQFGVDVAFFRKAFEARDTVEGIAMIGDCRELAIRKLNVRIDEGIKIEDIPNRKIAFGENIIPERPPKSYFDLLKGALQDATVIMLCVAAAVSLGLCIFAEEMKHDCIWEGTAIIGTVIFVSNLVAIQDYQKEKQFRKLNADVENVKVNTIRNGKKMFVSKYELVVGDIVNLSVGDMLHADGLLVEGYDIETDESALTGEPILIQKSVKEGPFMLSGTSVQNGQGKCIIVAVGVNSEKGRIQALIRGQKLSNLDSVGGTSNLDTVGGGGLESGGGGGLEFEDEEEEESLLTQKLAVIANLIGKVAVGISVFTFCVMGLSYFIRVELVGDDNDGSNDTVGKKILDWLITTITIVVVAVPEGLPLAVTLALALSVRKMQDDACLVKHLDATETMGSATTICTDKTGTLTQNRMTVVKAYFGKNIVRCSGLTTGYNNLSNNEKDLKAELMSRYFRDLLAIGICLNKAEADIEWSALTKRWQQQGNKTDCALLALAYELGVDYRQIAQNVSPQDIEKIYPFSSARKRAGLIIACNTLPRIQGNNTVVGGLLNNKGGAGGAATPPSGSSMMNPNNNNNTLLVVANSNNGGGVGTTHHALNPPMLTPGSSFAVGNGSVTPTTIMPSVMEGTYVNSPKEMPRTGYLVFMKGASEIMIALCDKKINPITGIEEDYTVEEKRETIRNVVTPFAKASLRTIALAFRRVEEKEDWDQTLSEETATSLTGQAAETFRHETELTFIALVGIEDPLRETVPAAIQKCNRAGVDVRMITGDNLDTAIAISKHSGILRPGLDIDENGNLLHQNVALTGPEFRKKVLNNSTGEINFTSFDQIWPYLRVLARSSPTDKYILVSGINESTLYEDQERAAQCGIYPDRQVVAVTGDGTNDAAALKRADVGFVMGITGTSVAKDAADIVILDDDFASIVEACLWGRNVHDSIAKFLQFQLTVNITAVSCACIGAFVFSQSPLRAVQLLWVNLIMDSLGALALASEPPVPTLLDRPPYGRNRSLMSYQMRCNMFGQSIYQMVILMIVLFGGAKEGLKRKKNEPHCKAPEFENGNCPHCGGIFNIPSGIGREISEPPTQHFTLLFNIFVQLQLMNWINCRKLYHEKNVFSGLSKNPIFCSVWSCCFIIQILLVEAGALGETDDQILACSADNPGFRTTHLKIEHWIISILFGMGSFIWQWVVIACAKTYNPDMYVPEKIPILERKTIIGGNGGGNTTSIISTMENNQNNGKSLIRQQSLLVVHPNGGGDQLLEGGGTNRKSVAGSVVVTPSGNLIGLPKRVSRSMSATQSASQGIIRNQSTNNKSRVLPADDELGIVAQKLINKSDE